MLLKQIGDQLFRWLRACSICGSGVPPISSTCERCLDLLLSAHRGRCGPGVSGYPFPVFSLIEWNRANHEWVQPFLYGLKGGWSYGALQNLAEILVSEVSQSMNILDGEIAIVHPPSSSGSFDHSAVFAHQLASLLGAPVVGLQAVPQKPNVKANRLGLKNPITVQKRKTASERHELRFQLPVDRANFSGLSHKWVFVDDVITTGATAMAAYMALDDPSDFAVLTIANRPKLAGISTV